MYHNFTDKKFSSDWEILYIYSICISKKRICFTIYNQITCFKDQWFSLYWIGYENKDYCFRFSQRTYRDFKE